MKEKEIKRIVKNSLTSPSPDFTEKLMARLDQEQLLKRKVNGSVILMTFVCLICIPLLSLFSPSSLEVYNYVIQIPKEIIQLGGILFIVFQWYQIYDLKRGVGDLKKINHTELFS